MNTSEYILSLSSCHVIKKNDVYIYKIRQNFPDLTKTNKYKKCFKIKQKIFFLNI